MSVLELFYQVKEVESMMADLYRDLKHRFASPPVNYEGLFQTLAEEEKMHERQVEMMLQYARESEAAFVMEENAPIRMQSLLNDIRAMREYLNRQETPPGIRQVLTIVLGFERDLRERHQTNYYRIEDLQIKALFRNLTEGDQAHLERIEAALRGLPSEESGNQE